jgi:hypothetical protein
MDSVISKPGSRTQQRARALTRRVLGRPRLWLVGAAGLVSSGLAVLLLYGMERAIGAHPSSLLLAFLGGCFVTSVLWAIWSAAFTMGGGATSAAGAEAELWTGDVLGMLGSGWNTYHNLVFRQGARGNWNVDVDHVAVGPDSKRYPRIIEHRDVGGLFRTDLRIYVGGRDRSKLTAGVMNQADRVGALLGAEVPVHPVLCFEDANWGLLSRGFTHEGVLVTWAKKLTGRLREPGSLSAVGIEEVARQLASHFPVA